LNDAQKKIKELQEKKNQKKVEAFEKVFIKGKFYSFLVQNDCRAFQEE
jgi:hypothetical protein